MKEKIKVLIASASMALVVLISNTAFAGWTTEFQIDKVYSGYTSGSVYVSSATSFANGGVSCSINIIEFRTTSSDPEKVLRLLLAAQLAGRPVQCNVTSCVGNYYLGAQCSINTP